MTTIKHLENNPRAAELVGLGSTMVVQGRQMIARGVVSLAIGRIAYFQGWGEEPETIKGRKVADFDAAMMPLLGETKSSRYRFAALVKAVSLKFHKDHKETLATLAASKDSDAETTLSLAVSALPFELRCVNDLADWTKKESKTKETPSFAAQLIKKIEAGSDKLGSDEELLALVKAIREEMKARKAAQSGPVAQSAAA